MLLKKHTEKNTNLEISKFVLLCKVDVRVCNNYFANFPLLRFRVCHAVGVGGLGSRSLIEMHIPKHSCITKSTNSLCRVFVQFANGGSGGIRTPVGLHPNGFRDRLVVTASIHFRILLFSTKIF